MLIDYERTQVKIKFTEQGQKGTDAEIKSLIKQK